MLKLSSSAALRQIFNRESIKESRCVKICGFVNSVTDFFFVSPRVETPKLLSVHLLESNTCCFKVLPAKGLDQSHPDGVIVAAFSFLIEQLLATTLWMLHPAVTSCLACLLQESRRSPNIISTGTEESRLPNLSSVTPAILFAMFIK